MTVRHVAPVVLAAAVLLHGAGDEPLWNPPALPGDQVLPEPTTPRDFVTRLGVAGYPIHLEKTRLSDVAARFGATIGEAGDAGDYVAWVCLQGESGSGHWALWLQSGEIHGGTVGGVLMRRLQRGQALDSRCVQVGQANVVLPVPLRLAAQAHDVVAALGKPTKRTPTGLLYVHTHTEAGQPSASRQGLSFDVTSTLRIQLSAGIVSAFELWHVTSS